MAKYFSTAISKICNLKYQEAKSVADQMVDVVEITFPDVKLNLQEPFEMGKYNFCFRKQKFVKLHSRNYVLKNYSSLKI